MNSTDTTPTRKQRPLCHGFLARDRAAGVLLRARARFLAVGGEGRARFDSGGRNADDPH